MLKEEFENLTPVQQLKSLGYKSAKKHKVVTEQEDKEQKERKHAEQLLQTKICNWINDTWPGTLFISDFSAGLFLPEWIAEIRSKQSCIDKFLDLTILEPRGKYHGLIIEIKTIDGTPFLKDGKTLKKSEHIEAQYKTILKFKSLNYGSCFGVGEDHIKEIILKYKSLPLNISFANNP